MIIIKTQIHLIIKWKLVNKILQKKKMYIYNHRSEYTPLIFVNILFYLFMWQYWRNDTLLQCKVVSVQLYLYNSVNVLSPQTAGHKSEYTPKWKCPNWAQDVNTLCGHHYFPALP